MKHSLKALFLAIFLTPSIPWAGTVSVEFGGGYSTSKLANSETGKGGAGLLGFDYALLTSSWASINFGFQARYFALSKDSSTTTSSSSASTLNTSDQNYLFMTPKIRLEVWNISISGGYTPYVYNSSLDKYQGYSAYHVDAEILFPITPEIDFGIMGSQQWMTSDDSTRSLNPATMYGAFFRLHYGWKEKGKTAERTFKGWRYPFGIRK